MVVNSPIFKLLRRELVSGVSGGCCRGGGVPVLTSLEALTSTSNCDFCETSQWRRQHWDSGGGEGKKTMQ